MSLRGVFGEGGGGAVDSVNGQTGVVVLDLQDVTDAGATTTNTTTFSPSGNNKAVVVNGSGSGIGLDITHSGSGVKLNIGATGSGDAIRFDTDKFVVNDDGDISSSLFTASRALATNASKEIITSATTATELGYLSGVTSAVQTQLDSKVDGTLTATRIPFAADSNTLDDDAGLTWDDTLKRQDIYSTTGSELLTNGTFTGNATGWTVPTGWSYSSNTVVHGSNGTGALTPSTALTTVLAGQLYQYSIDISALTVGSVTLACGGVTQTAFSANGTYTGKFLATANTNLTLTPTNTSRFTVDNVSLKRLSGGSLVTGSTWSQLTTSVQGALGTTTADAFVVDNPTSATSGATVQASPAYRWRGRSWTGAASQTVDFRTWVLPTASSVPSGIWKLQHSTNGAAFADLLSVDSNTQGGSGVKITTAFGQSNGSPGTTRAVVMENSGSHTWTDYSFLGVVKANIGVDNQGQISLYAGGGSYVGYYNKNSGALFAYNYPTAFFHYGNIQASGHGMFGANVGAGTGSSTVPTSTLQTAGSTALKVKRITASQSLDGTGTHWLIDATSASACAGTPTYACSTHTSQGACEANDAHGGCTWTTGSSCDVYNGDQSNCQGTSGCTYDTASCSGFGDEGTCNSYSGCSWGSSDCGSFDESTCSTYSGAGCTQNYSDCSVFNGSEGACSGQSGCSVSSSNTCSSQYDESSCSSAGCYWDGMSCIGDNSTCSGSYFTSCSGTYYNCTGDYYTGNCSGTYGGGCTGTSTCSGIDDSTSCGAEAGCTWSSVLNATLPDGETCPDRTYWIYNDSSGGADVVILPYSGQTVNETTSYTLAAYRDWVHFAYFKKTGDCATVSEGSCAGTSGCTANYYSCSWDSMENTCSGGEGCSGYGDESSCNAATYYAGCSGSYTISKNWYKFGS
jgi:hypothetical protein